jgi:hypothetical protein
MYFVRKIEEPQEGQNKRDQGRRKARAMTPMRTRKRARMTVHMQPADDFSSILRMAIVALDTLAKSRRETGRGER